MQENPTDNCYPTYITTGRVEGLRTRIFGERIVVVLGEDEEGGPLELSISLEKREGRVGSISISSIVEPIFDLRRQRLHPRPVITPCEAVNVFNVSIETHPSDGIHARLPPNAAPQKLQDDAAPGIAELTGP